MPAEVLKKRKIAVLGSRSVGAWLFPVRPGVLRLCAHETPLGKSSLVIQFIENHFVESYYPTIESTFSKTINLNGTNYDCDIIDTAGQVRPAALPVVSPVCSP
jgi:Ras homolog enriched in brain